MNYWEDVNLIQKRAEEFIREHAQDVEFLTIHEGISYREWEEIDDDLDHHDTYARAIDKAIRAATVKVYFP